ncbi:MAG: hypothetical protein COA41_07940 [Sphingopyxis sp.]|nr:MAG: hypothetical protein COA41_07940 [Sphingopyxis sp.]
MTKQVIRDTPAGRDRPVEITPQMIEAGVDTLTRVLILDHGDDRDGIVSQIYESMHRSRG